MTSAAFAHSWMDSACGCGDATHPERYAISVADVSQAWVFHTHERAVTTARELTRLMGRLHEVVPLRGT